MVYGIMTTTEYTVRPAQATDVPAMFKLVQELARFEQAEHEIMNTEAQLLQDGFGEQPVFYALVAEQQAHIVGLLLYFYSYSTWKGKSIYVDDFIVDSEHRHKGVGTLLFNAILQIAEGQAINKLHWQVLNWNEPAIQFYQKQGAILDNEWSNCALNRQQVQHLVSILKMD